MLSRSLIAFALVSLVSARSVRRGWHVHERRDDAPTGFVYTGPANPNQVIQFRVALTQNNPDGLIQALHNVSDPDHSQYGQHLSQDDVNQYFAPTNESAQAVRDFLQAHGVEVSQLSPAGDWLGFNTTVAQANNMFDAEYSVFRHLDSGSDSTNTLSYALPAAIKPHLSFVHPGISFFQPIVRDSTPLVDLNRRDVKLEARGGQCTDKPDCFQSLYGLPKAMASRDPRNGIVVTGGGDPASHSDLQMFLKQFRPDIAGLKPAYDYIDKSLDDGTDDQKKAPGGEENLDVQWTAGLANGIPVYYYALGNKISSSGSNWIDLANTLHGMDDKVLPKVMTTSYGFGETGLSSSFTQNLCNAYAALGARGVSIMFASGDSGPGANKDCTQFNPGFPGTCPYVTTVGGTSGANPEVGIGYSGGGFSNVFKVPDYQKAVVQSYVQGMHGNNSNLFKADGRAYPDVAAQAAGVSFVMKGKVAGVGGTSLASPIFAATIALLNDKLYAAGKKPLGFLNPWLYKNAGMLNDIKTGFMTDGDCHKGTGFKAGSGWDPVTGLGTPNFGKMLKAAGV